VSARVLQQASAATFYTLLIWSPLAWGAYRDWPLAVAELLALASLLLWILGMIVGRRLELRRTALDFPLCLFIVLVLVQLVLGNRPLAHWALAPPAINPELPVELPRVIWSLGTVSPAQTVRTFRLFLTYVAVYVLVVNLVRTRRQLHRLVETLVLLGGALAFLGLLDYLAGEAWLLSWRDHPSTGRLAGTFVNPDHFAAWLSMLVSLGLGYLLAARGWRANPGSLRALLGSREGRERALRRALPFVGIAVMAIALVFTLSRAGVLSLLLTLGAILALEGALGRTRGSLVLVGILLAVTLGYGAWIGFEPFLDRLSQSTYGSRWILTSTTLPMLASFPLLGVGLGAYREIYFRYQPLALAPGRLFVPFAHNDLLQIVVETGFVGAALLCFTVWRVGADLLAAHFFGRGRCPVGGGEEEGARRGDPFSVSIALGALGSVFALLVHSAFDFAARIPANGILGATCLGIATVALHTRFTSGGERLLTTVRVRSLGTGRLGPAVLGASAVALALALVPWLVRPPLVEARLRAVPGDGALGRVDRVLALDPGEARALEVRAKLRAAAALGVWNTGRDREGRILRSWEERRPEARTLLAGAVTDLRMALSLTPTNPFLHEVLGEIHGTTAMIDPAAAPAEVPAALTSFHRAIALAPENPFFYRSLAALALGQQRLELALGAARDAIRRDPTLLADLVDEFLAANLSDTRWVALAPDSALDQLELGALLEQNGLVGGARQAYRRAAELAPPDEAPFVHWMLGRLLTRQGDYRGALFELDGAISQDPDNPELELARALALARRGDPAALDAHRAAVFKAEARVRRHVDDDALPFKLTAPRARALASRALGPGALGALRYRHALAEYLLDRKLWQQAVREWELVLAEDPRDAQAQFGRGTALHELGDRDQALEAYRKAVSLDGRSAAFRFGLAGALWETDQYYQAMSEWRAVIARDPGNVRARLALAGAYLKVGERIEAFREYQRILQMEPDQPEARRAIARLGKMSES
jgi:tetratricopeptide (TPR) repeat protein/O-antigen ligase